METGSRFPDSLVEDTFKDMFASRGVSIGHDPNYKLQTGRYKGKTISKVSRIDPMYVVEKCDSIHVSFSTSSFHTHLKQTIMYKVLYAYREQIRKAADPLSEISKQEWWDDLGDFRCTASIVSQQKIMAQVFEFMKCGVLPNWFEFRAITSSREEIEDRNRCIDFLRVRRRCQFCGEKLTHEDVSNVSHVVCTKVCPLPTDYEYYSFL